MKKVISIVMAVIIAVFTVPLTVFATNTSTNASYAGGWGISWVRKTLYGNSSKTETVIGRSLPAGVGFTILDYENGCYLIYTEPAKLYWIEGGQLTINTTSYMTGTVLKDADAYGGVGTNVFEYVGSIHAGNFVTILAQSGTYYYVEFNDSTYLRKRGWVPASSVSKWSDYAPGEWSSLTNTITKTSTTSIDLYYAPGSGYPAFRSMPAGTTYSITYYMNIHGEEFALISYKPTINDKAVAAYIKT